MADAISAKTAWALAKAIKGGSKRKGPTNGTATVVRVDQDGTHWVRISGSDVETPVNGAITVDAKAGDTVQYHLEDTRISITGNATSPSVGGTYVSQAMAPVESKANTALAEASRAKEAADTAESEAYRAHVAADAAQTSADEAATAASNAQTSADTAAGAASAALTSARSANTHAVAALNSLATVEDVVDTLAWVTEHGTMAATTDTAIDPTKVYFVRDNNGEYVVGSYRYAIVQEPTASGLSSYYELSIDKSVQNYIATHLSLTNEGLWLTPTSSNGYRVLIATGAGTTYTTAGTYIIDNSGNIRAVIGETITLGGSGEGHVVIDANGFNYFSSENYRVAHMGSDIRLSPRGYGNGLFMRPTSEGGIGLSLSNQQGGSPEYPSGKAGNYSIAAGKSVSASRMGVEGGQIVGLVPVDVGTDSTGSGSIAVGRALQALSDYQAVFGRMNVPDENGDYALIVGNGHTMTHEEEEEKAQEVGDGSFINIARSNALTVDWDGRLWLAGNITATSIELKANTSFIDFHFNNSTADYTSRIIENTSGHLNLIASNGVSFNGGALGRDSGGTGQTGISTSSATLSGCTASGQRCWHNGVTCSVTMIGVKLSSALANGASVAFGTLPSGYRPPQVIYDVASCDSATFCGRLVFRVGTDGALSITNLSGSSMPANTAFSLFVTFAI